MKLTANSLDKNLAADKLNTFAGQGELLIDTKIIGILVNYFSQGRDENRNDLASSRQLINGKTYPSGNRTHLRL
jgi:hypothetical protein